MVFPDGQRAPPHVLFSSTALSVQPASLSVIPLRQQRKAAMEAAPYRDGLAVPVRSAVCPARLADRRRRAHARARPQAWSTAACRWWRCRTSSPRTCRAHRGRPRLPAAAAAARRGAAGGARGGPLPLCVRARRHPPALALQARVLTAVCTRVCMRVVPPFPGASKGLGALAGCRRVNALASVRRDDYVFASGHAVRGFVQCCYTGPECVR